MDSMLPLIYSLIEAIESLLGSTEMKRGTMGVFIFAASIKVLGWVNKGREDKDARHELTHSETKLYLT